MSESVWCLLAAVPLGAAVAQEDCDEGTLWEPYGEICADVRDRQQEFWNLAIGLSTSASAKPSRDLGISESPGNIQTNSYDDFPVPGRMSVGTLYSRGYLEAVESGRLHTRMFVHPDGLGEDSPLPLFYTPATTRIDGGLEFCGVYSSDGSGIADGLGRVALFAWTCVPDYPCPNGSESPRWQWFIRQGDLPCHITHDVDQGGHANKMLYYANHTDKLMDGTPPLWRSALYLWNYCDAAWDLAWEHEYRQEKQNCSTANQCAFWGPAIETFSTETHPRIAEIGFEDSLLYHDGRWSDLRPPETGFWDLDTNDPLPLWQVFHRDPNRSWGVGNFLNENDPPSIEGQIDLDTLEDEPIELNQDHLVIDDPDVDPAYHSSFELTLYGGDNYTFSGTRVIPAGNFAGTLTVPVTVSDGAAESPVFDLQIDVLPVNDLPEFVSAPPTKAAQDEPYAYEVQATDPDGDSLEISAPNLPAWLTFSDNGDGTASLAGTPGNADVGDHDVELVVDDGKLGTATQDFTIVVADANDPPVFTSTATKNATEGIRYTYRITTEDADADVVTISAPVLPLWLTLNDTGDGTATLTGIPGSTDAGAHPVQLLADDGNAGTATQEFTVTVADVNSAPNITSRPPNAITEGNEYRYLIAVADPDLDTIEITAPTLPGWLTFADHGDGTAMLTGTPTGTDVGGHPVEIVAADSLGATDNQQFTITVTAAADGPVITLNGDASVTVAVGQAYNDAGATASDPQDGDLSDRIVVDNPVNTDEVGTYTITYTVEDTAGNRAQAQRTVTVQAAPPPPPASRSGGGGGGIGLADVFLLVSAASLGVLSRRLQRPRRRIRFPHRRC